MLLYGAEFWILNISLLKKLESFQAEIGKRILRLPKSTANNVVLLALQWPSIRARVLCIKLAFLLKLMNYTDSLSSRVFRSLAINDVEALHLVRQCRFLESRFDSNFTTRILSSPADLSRSRLKKEIVDTDWSLLLSESSEHHSQQHVYRVAISSQCSWPKVWDFALDYTVLRAPHVHLLF